MNALILKAKEFARDAHKAQSRRYTGEPYFVHLEEVAGMVEREGLSENAIASAYLHDVIEDQGVSMQVIADNFGQDILIMVVAITDHPVRPGINREQRKTLDRERLSKASPEVQGIKCADLISNTSSIVKHDPDFAKLYLKEKRAVLEVLNKAPPALRDAAWASLRSAEDALLQNALADKELAGAVGIEPT